MKKSELKEVERYNKTVEKRRAREKGNFFRLTEEEHINLNETFFQIQSTVRIVAQNCFDHAITDDREVNTLLTDTSNILKLAEEKLKVMEKMIGK